MIKIALLAFAVYLFMNPGPAGTLIRATTLAPVRVLNIIDQPKYVDMINNYHW